MNRPRRGSEPPESTYLTAREVQGSPVYQTFDESFEEYISKRGPVIGAGEIRRRSPSDAPRPPPPHPPREPRARALSLGNTETVPHSTFEEDFVTYINKDFVPRQPCLHREDVSSSQARDDKQGAPSYLTLHGAYTNGDRDSEIYSDANRESTIYATIADTQYDVVRPGFPSPPRVGFSQLEGRRPSIPTHVSPPDPTHETTPEEVESIYLHPQEIDAFRR